MKKLSKLFIFLLSMNTSYQIKAQGCSDAGFCTLNSFKPATTAVTFDSILAQPITYFNQIKVGASVGKADMNITAIGFYIEYNRLFNDKLSADVKVTGLSQNGQNISATGISDAYLNLNYRPISNLGFTGGLKLPFTQGNYKINAISLPMDYQSSLGTFDILFGISYMVKRFQLVAALQQPITQNKNSYLSEIHLPGSIYGGFTTTNKFKRAGDVLLRASYPIKIGEKFTISPSILGIYHLTQDKFTDMNGVERSITGSEGFTLNGVVFIDYALNERSALQLNAGMPFIIRKVRPDGLTRAFVLTLEYKHKF
jgi:hypothetical protein